MASTAVNKHNVSFFCFLPSMFWIPLLLRVFGFFSFFDRVYGFDFIVSPPTQCGAVRFNWVGGVPPFSALIIPPGGTIRNVSIPASAWNDKDQSGDFSTVLPLPEKQSVMFSMADATGVTAGGITDIVTVGPPPAGAQSCNITDPGTDFIFALDGTLSQCKPYPFTLYASSGAVQPVTILVTVPHGESFLLHPPPVGDEFTWQANLTAGTSVVFSMMDAQNRVGGTDKIQVVGPSDDSSCLRPLPSSAPPTRIPTPTSSSSPTNTDGNGGSGGSSDNRKGDNTGIIIGASVGGAVALLIIVALVYFRTKGKRKLDAFGGRDRVDLTEPGPDASSYLLDPQQLGQYPSGTAFPLYRDGTTPQAGPAGVPPTMTAKYNNTPNDPAGFNSRGVDIFADGVAMGATAAVWARQQSEPPTGNKQWGAMARQQPHHSQYSQYSQHPQQEPLYYDPYEMGSASSMAGAPSAYPSMSGRPVTQTVSDGQFGVDPASNYSASVGPSTTSSTRSGKRLSALAQPAQRLIVHTDIEDEPIELPPMYSESRAPIPGMEPFTGPAPHRDMR